METPAGSSAPKPQNPRKFDEDFLFTARDLKAIASESDSGYEAGYETDADESELSEWEGSLALHFAAGSWGEVGFPGGLGTSSSVAGGGPNLHGSSRKRKMDALVNMTLRLSLGPTTSGGSGLDKGISPEDSGEGR